MAPRPLRVIVLSSGTTIGHRNNDADWLRLLGEAGVDATMVRPKLPRIPFLSLPLIDLVQSFLLAVALRRANRRIAADWFFLATTTAAFLLPRDVLQRSAVRFDALACENRRGRLGWLSRTLERRALPSVPILMPMSSVRDDALPRETFLRDAQTVIPVPPPLPDEVGERHDEHSASTAVVCYAGNPAKKGLDIIVAAWNLLPDTVDAHLSVAGVDEAVARHFLAQASIDVPDSVTFVGVLDRDDFAQTLSSAGVYLAATRYEDYGMSQLEALNAGAAVVTVPSAGPFEAAALLRETAPAFLSSSFEPADLARTLERALAMDPAQRAALVRRVRDRLGPYRWSTQVALVRDQLLPRCTALADVDTAVRVATDPRAG